MTVSVVVAGGHSAGHIEPAMNVADAIRQLDPAARITALGTVRGLDTTLVPARGYPLELIPPVPFPRRLGADLFRLPFRVRAAVAAAREVLERVDAQVVVGFGGYVAAPAYLAARRLGIPILVHEANARAGLANRMAARLTSNVFAATEGSGLRHAVVVGMPLRPAIAGLDRRGLRPAASRRLGLEPDRTTLLVTGGSQGARRINQAVLGAQDALRVAGIQVLHLAGPANPASPPARAAGEPPYVVLPFLDSMADAYAAVDFVLCRSGAMTCAELTAVGLAAAYVPLPLRGGEQRLNAVGIVKAGGGLMVDDEGCTAKWVADTVIPLLVDPARLATASAAAAGCGARDGAAVLARTVLEVANG